MFRALTEGSVLLGKEIVMNPCGKSIALIVVMSAALMALCACEKKEGPAEKAGRKLDDAAATVGQQIEKAGSDIKDEARGDKK